MKKMSKNLRFTLYTIICVFAFIGVYFLYDYLSEQYFSDEKNAEITDVIDDTVEVFAKDFTVTDISGGEISYKDIAGGKPTVINFWASWCPPCVAEMPYFQQLYEEYGDRVQFIMVNVTSGKETVQTAKSFISENSYTFPVFFDESYNAAETYEVYSLPTTVFIDEDGIIKILEKRMLPHSLVQRGIQVILGE